MARMTGTVFGPGKPIRRIALLSPWAGGNLGNSAIISAVLTNISERNPAIQFLGITLNPVQTRLRFGIEAFPLAAVSRHNYWQSDSDSSKNVVRQNSKSQQVKTWLKRIAVVRSLLSVIRKWIREVVHIATAARIVGGLDAVMIPGGGALDEFWGGPWAHPWSLLKWSVLSWICRVPFLFVSVGKCSLEHPISRLFVRVALSLATYRSYRDPDSKIAVQAVIDAPDDPVFPDLAFSYPVPVLHTPEYADLHNSRLIVGVSPIAYCDPRVWPLKDERRYAVYVRRLADIVKWLLNEGHHLLFFATDSPDLETIRDVLTCIGDAPRNSDAILTLPGPVQQSINHHLEGIGRTDLIVASRLHGVILSHLVAKPVLAISYDPKVDSQMRIARQNDYCLDINALELDKFVERFEALKAARLREAAYLRSLALLFRQQLDSQYDRIFGIKLHPDHGRVSESEQPASVQEGY
jgi:polysaccharide pyruvyl transferase WcaK-like protein